MRVTAWHNGSGSYGVNIPRLDRQDHFRKEWDHVVIHLEDQSFRANITPCFWNSCPHLRSPHIKAYLTQRGLIPWADGAPPVFELTPLGGSVFHLGLVSH